MNSASNAEPALTVCFCNSNIPWGGGEKWHLEAALALAARGWRVFLLCHPRGELYQRAMSEPSLAVAPCDFSRLSFLNPLVYHRMACFFRQEQIHAVIMNLPLDLKCAGLAAKRAGVRHIIYRRGSALPVRDSFLNRYLFQRVITRLIVNSEETRRMALQHNQNLIPNECITLLHNGVDAAAFDAALEAATTDAAPWEEIGNTPISRNYSSPSTPQAPPPLILGNAGRLNVQKGQHLFLYLGAALVKKRCDVRLILAGGGERETELRALAVTLGIANRVAFTGFLHDLAPFWKKIDLFVLTSIWEGFGFVLLEAMLAQKPIVAFDISNIPELIQPGVNGLLFPLPPDAANTAITPNLSTMADSILLLAEDPTTRARMGKLGRAFAQKHFSQALLMDKLESLLQ